MEFKGTQGQTKLFKECFKNEYDFYVQPLSTSSSNNILFANAYGKTEEEAQANAQLIAASTELLEMLKLFLTEFEYDNATEYECELFFKAKQLIKKATTL
jgi:hypothetical protein